MKAQVKRYLGYAVVPAIPVLLLLLIWIARRSGRIDADARRSSFSADNPSSGGEGVDFHSSTGMSATVGHGGNTVRPARLPKRSLQEAIAELRKTDRFVWAISDFEHDYLEEVRSADQEDLRKALEDTENPVVRAALLVALGRMNKDRLVQLLATYTQANDLLTRLSAAYGLSVRSLDPSRKADDEVGNWLERTKWLKVLRDVAFPPPLDVLAADVQPVNSVEARRAILTMLDSDHESANQMAYMYLLRKSIDFEDVAVALRHQLANSSDEDMRIHAAQVLSGTTQTTALAALRERIEQDPSSRVRIASIRALGESKDETALDFLATALTKVDGVGEKRAILTAVSYGSSEKYTEVLVRASREESDHVVVADAVDLLGTRQGDSAFEALVHVLQFGNPGYLQSLAADKLAERKDKRAISYLEGVLASTQSAGIREAVEKALAKLR